MRRKLTIGLLMLLWAFACNKSSLHRPEKPTALSGPQGQVVKTADASPSVIPAARPETGTATADSTLVPEKRVSFSAIHVALGGDHSLIVNRDGTLWTAGSNEFGQLGIKNNVDPKTGFHKVMEHVCDVAAGRDHSLVLACDGTVWAAGSNSYGQLGVPAPERNLSFRKIATDVAAIAARGLFSMLIKRHQSLWVTGYEAFYLLGVGKPGDLKTFTKAMDGVRAVSIGDRHVLILKTDGTVWGSGDNTYDQLGIEPIDNQGEKKFPTQVPAPVQLTSEAIAVSAGTYHSLVLKKDNTLWGSGWNEYGQLAPAITRTGTGSRKSSPRSWPSRGEIA
jgi:alpha-tubulin suppressor-like RCC1 family protein